MEYYRRFMEECRDVDYSLLGRGDEVGVQLYRNIWSGRHAQNRGLERIFYRHREPDGREEIRLTREGGCEVRGDLDADLLQMPRMMLVSHHRAHTKAGASAQ